MFSRIKEVPKLVFLVIGFTLVVVIALLILGPDQYELISEFSGGAGETTTENFRLENNGRIRVTHFSYFLIHPNIEVCRTGEDQPFTSMFWMPDDSGLSPDDIMLGPGDYYIIVEAGSGSSWTIVVEEETS